MSLTPEEIARTGQFLAELQEPDGALPWFRGDQWDAWNHTEALMGLTVAGVGGTNETLLTAARAGLEHLRRTQRDDGTWPMLVRDRQVVHDEADTNQCAYPAVGVWHYALATGDESVCERYWPMVQRAIERVLTAQLPDGAIAWVINADGGLGDHALLTGCASILQSLWAARAIAATQGVEVPEWDEAGMQLAEAVARRPERFADRGRYSMDWFYPVLGGALVGVEAEAHLARSWDRFVWPGHGVRCVDDRPWVTGGESAELVLALMCAVSRETPAAAAETTTRARAVFEDIQRLRDDTGGYWTGYVVDDDAYWPVEQTGWTAGAMLLAADALDGLTPAANFFRDMTWLATPTPRTQEPSMAAQRPAIPTLPPAVQAAADATTGFMPKDEGEALFAAACGARPGTWLEIGTYCGKSTVLLAQAAREVGGTQLVTVDHHHGSEENQPGWEWHDTSLVDPASGRLDTLPTFRRTWDEHLSDVVTAVVATTEQVASWWTTPVEFCFLDGNHVEEMAQHDYAAFATHVTPGGLLAVHDVFPNPDDGGQAPWNVVKRALSEGFSQISQTGSLRVLRRDA